MLRLSAIVMILAIGVLSAGAQGSGGTGGSSAGGTGAGMNAPVGHRQPTQSAVAGAEKGNPGGQPGLSDAEDKALDKKIRSICRGC